jgi:hypothetical protein
MPSCGSRSTPASRRLPLRVAYYTGQGDAVRINTFDVAAKDEGGDHVLFAEYMPPGAYPRAGG